MISMAVSIEHAVNMPKISLDSLQAKFGSSIDQKACLPMAYPERTAGTPVFRIFTAAHMAIAGDDRDSVGCSGS
jgi:hypothetical protein